ncbi:MAG: hypothetical protein A2Z11_03385 [Candidatus Woykebacteria bacterium RBG_16_43_9]|uniref:Uncharacterized protein n=1 Tax=Candidatus Woykebacteria bacterium RBG_16_43_9 TaxID=1802596 RepID=A0A1G1WHA5_9BACT|nr:MAG: hypothetical protein A2Z11_03385 [Candidatus Woykebacteria bacterium RBG_16_43_9]
MIRKDVIEGRKTKGSLLLAHPSRPLHYVATKPAASGAWKSQKSSEQVLLHGQVVWECFLIEQIHRRVLKKWREELEAFLDLVNQEETNRIWLDTDFRFWTPEWSEWSFDYKSEGNFELYQGRAEVFRGRSHVYTGICVAGLAQQ